MTSLAALPEKRIEDLPIPEDVRPTAKWPASLVEMAEYIGGHATLLLAERFGGKELYIRQNATDWHVGELIGRAKAQKLCEIYGLERFPMPVAKKALFDAKAGPIIQGIRERRISLTEGAHILRTSRTYLSGLVNADPATLAPPPRSPRRHSIHQLDLFSEEDKAA